MTETIHQFAPVLAVVAALIGLVAAVLKRRTTVTHRHEFPHLPAPPSTASHAGRDSTPEAREIELGRGIAVVGQHLCKGDHGIPLRSIENVNLRRPFTNALSGIVLLGAAAGVLLWALDEGSWGLGALGAVLLICGLWMWDTRVVEIATRDGRRRVIASDLTSDEAQKIRNRILAAR